MRTPSKINNNEWILLFTFYFLFLFPRHASAYVDPGSLAIIIQVSSAFVIGAILTFRRKIVQFLRMICKKSTKAEITPESMDNPSKDMTV